MQKLDGGKARGTYEKPNARGEPDGVPCENVCGHDARAMVKAIWAEKSSGKAPFMLPMARPTKICDPA